MNLDAPLDRACRRVPGLVRGALVLVPDGFLLAATHGASSMDLEPLIRSTVRCLAQSAAPHGTPALGMPALGTPSPLGEAPIVEYLFVIHDQLVVIQASRANRRLALAAECEPGHNVGFVLGASRLALAEIEAAVDFTAWGV